MERDAAARGIRDGEGDPLAPGVVAVLAQGEPAPSLVVTSSVAAAVEVDVQAVVADGDAARSWKRASVRAMFGGQQKQLR